MIFLKRFTKNIRLHVNFLKKPHRNDLSCNSPTMLLSPDCWFVDQFIFCIKSILHCSSQPRCSTSGHSCFVWFFLLAFALFLIIVYLVVYVQWPLELAMISIDREKVRLNATSGSREDMRKCGGSDKTMRRSASMLGAPMHALCQWLLELLLLLVSLFPFCC